MTTRRAALQQIRPTLTAAAAVTLTALALSPTLSDGPWVMSTLLVIAATAVIGGCARAFALPGWAVITVQAIGLVFLLTWLFAREVAVAGFVPNAAALQTFGDLINDGSLVVEQEVAPVSVTAGVGFLVVGGVALIAWAVDAIAVTSRQATLAGVPLLALYLVPATVLPDGVPWPLFVAAGVGWLILLLEDGRLQMSRWGRPVEGGTETSAHSVGGTGRRLGAAALTVAVIVPVILPALDDGRFGGGSGDGSGDGSGGSGVAAGESTVITVNPITDLQRNLTQADDTELLFYTTDTGTPEYLRIATLDQFDGQTWTLEDMRATSEQQAAAGLPLPPGLTESVARTPVTYDITVGALDTPRLPLPYPVSSVAIDGDWRWDEQTFDVFSPVENGSAFNQSYRANALAIDPTVAQLRAAPAADPSLNGLLQLPTDVDELLTPLAATVTGDAVTGYDQALALQNWFLTDFDYSLDTVEGNGTNALRGFLDDRSGYCEQFAATMALMARTLGIPSRVQVGFTPGELVDDDDPDTETWLVTVHDAHSWPELWFEGVGWVRFEPTPGGGDGRAAPGYAPLPSSNGDPGTGNGGDRGSGGGCVLRRGGCEINNRGGRPNSDLTEVLRANRAGGEFGPSTSAEQPGGDSSTVLLWLLLIVGAVALTSAPKVAAVVVHHRRWAGVSSAGEAVTAAWADVLDAATDVDLSAASTETPRDLAERLPSRGRLATEPAADLRQLATWVELLVYRESMGIPVSISGIKLMADAIHTDLLQGLSSRDRRLATWWPASGRAALARGWNATSEGASAAWARLLSRISRRPARGH